MELHLISPHEAKTLSRPISIHVEDEEINICIEETEQLDIIPAIGSDLFLDILDNPDDSKYTLLLNGGNYKDCKGKKRIFKGLKSTVAYYTYGRILKLDGKIAGRSGFIQHNDEYYSHVENKQRVISYNDAFNIADRYLTDVLLYLQETNPNKQGCCKQPIVKNKRTRIIAIGD